MRGAAHPENFETQVVAGSVPLVYSQVVSRGDRKEPRADDWKWYLHDRAITLIFALAQKNILLHCIIIATPHMHILRMSSRPAPDPSVPPRHDWTCQSSMSRWRLRTFHSVSDRSIEWKALSCWNLVSVVEIGERSSYEARHAARFDVADVSGSTAALHLPVKKTFIAFADLTWNVTREP